MAWSLPRNPKLNAPFEDHFIAKVQYRDCNDERVFVFFIQRRLIEFVYDSSMGRKKFTAKERFEVFVRCGFRCHYCGATAETSRLHVDHVIPVMQGGDVRGDNLVAACERCNLGKGCAPIGCPSLRCKISDEQVREAYEANRRGERTLKESAIALGVSLSSLTQRRILLGIPKPAKRWLKFDHADIARFCCLVMNGASVNRARREIGASHNTLDLRERRMGFKIVNEAFSGRGLTIQRKVNAESFNPSILQECRLSALMIATIFTNSLFLIARPRSGNTKSLPDSKE